MTMKTLPCCKKGNKGDSNLKRTTDFLKVINEKNRLKILCILKDNEKCVCDILEVLQIPQNLTSHHLKTLKDAGLITSRQEGRKVIYSSNKKAILESVSQLNKFLTSNL